MPRVHLSRRAQRDFDDIIDYLAGVASAAGADKYGRNIQAAINRLAEMPELAARRDEFRGNTRVAIVHRYLIFYEISADRNALLQS